jgi:glutathione S-transferase
MVHLCSEFPEKLKNFYGSCPRERDLINQYLSWYQSTFRPVFLKPVKLKYDAAFMKKKVSVIAYAEAYSKLKDMLYLVDKLLSKGSGYLVGESLSIADLLFCCETTNI